MTEQTAVAERTLPLTEAIREALIEEMQRDDKVFLVGQDIRGGIYPHTVDLVQQFGEERVVDTPIAECGMYGTAFGAAQDGYRPVVDFMFGAFSYFAGGELFCQTAQYHFLHGSQIPLPMVIMAGVGAGMRLANEHSMTPHGTFLHHPGIKVVFPSNAADAKGLMKAAIRDNNPVAFFWHFATMMDRGVIPDGDHVVPLGVADIKREGSDVTVLAIGIGVKHALAVAKKLEAQIDVEVIDPRTLEPFDMDTLLRSLAKTNRLVIVDEDYERCGFAGEIAAQVIDRGFDLLDAPIKRVCFPNMPIPGGYMEPYIIPNVDKIEAAIRQVCA
jgi:pyruvate dehydrogenase E1 component beta subunit